MYTYPVSNTRIEGGKNTPRSINLMGGQVLSHNKVGYKASTPVLLNSQPPLRPSHVPVAGNGGKGMGINLPDRGIVFFNLALLEKYIINKKTKNFRLPSLSSLHTGNISLTGIKLHQSGNILNEVRKNTQHSTIGHFKSYPFNHHFPLFNRRAIVGHKFTFSFNVQ
jgi:hypothetical protein